MYELIVSEKDNTAKRIAQILSNGKLKTEKIQNIPVYFFSSNGKEFYCVGLKGHILKVDFPLEYQDWQKVEPSKLIDAPIIKVPTQKMLIKTLQRLAKDAGSVIIACDFDREGELIGVDALNKICEVNSSIKTKRARFSALTEAEIKKAFSNLDDIYENLARAGEARQDIDLIWGATLTRFLSLTSRRLWKQFLSVGRVQSPTLCLIVQREKEREAFVSKPYWQLKALFNSDSKELHALHKKERFWVKDEVREVLAKLGLPEGKTKTEYPEGKKGVVTTVKKQERSLDAPAPFNTTSFLTAAAGLGISPSAAMRGAENLYMNGFISYPRVDNTVYPSSLDMRGILNAIKESPDLGKLAREILTQKEIIPTRGKKFSTDHPPIHPTGVAFKENLKPTEWKLYELVYRRFLATLAPSALLRSVNLEVEVNGEPFVARGTTVLNEGWLKFYPYGQKKEKTLPDLSSGDEVALVEVTVEEKETQPPVRYSQGQLIKKMDEMGLGTKSTRHEIIKNLYDRLYIHSDPIIPTELGRAVAEALIKYAGKIATPEMTAELEKEMDAIAEGKLGREEVVNQSRNMLGGVMLSLSKNKSQVAEEIWSGLKEDKVIGKCLRCGSDLRIIRSKGTKKKFVGCKGYPECTMSYPLPQKGEVIALGEVCEVCGAPKVKVVSLSRQRGGKQKPWILCININCPSKTNLSKKNESE